MWRCGIIKKDNETDSCWSLPNYPCCVEDHIPIEEDESGKWAIENGDWCGINSISKATPTSSTTTTTKTSISTDPYYNKNRKQSPYPKLPSSNNDNGHGVCGSWAPIDNVCCASYCDNQDSTQGCETCGGINSEHCKVVDSFACRSGDRGYDFHEIPMEFHYSRSTHFGLTVHGACGFGLYQVCGSDHKYTGEFASLCDAFCKAYPTLCKDPEGISYRGNFAAPQGNYYTQFWGSLDGDRDNYLSCGECFEVYKTKEDGSDYKPGEEGYQPPVLLSVIDSCPCNANGKWCCGSEWDQCQEVNNFKYGCPIPKDSIHLDLSDIAMARLQSGSSNGFMEAGVIPNKYRRVPCPRIGNMYIWLRDKASEYWFAFTVVNSAGYGAMAIVEVRGREGKWVKMERDPNYTSHVPQERYGTWVIPQNSGPYTLPIDIRLTDGSGVTIVAENAIKSFTPPADSIEGFYYIDIGVNFPEIPMPNTE